MAAAAAPVESQLLHWSSFERSCRLVTWLVTILSGICCAAMAYLINLGIEGIDKLRFMATLHLIKPGGGSGLGAVVQQQHPSRLLWQRVGGEEGGRSVSKHEHTAARALAVIVVDYMHT
jgi:hypothetical protein